MEDYNDIIINKLEKIKEEGYKYVNPISSKITKDSKEVSISNGILKISPVKDCVAITLRGLSQQDFKHDASLITLFLKTYDSELKNRDVVNISIISKNPHQIWKGFYADSKYMFFNHGVIINNNEFLEIKVSRNGKSLEIKDFKLCLECDKWYKTNEI